MAAPHLAVGLCPPSQTPPAPVKGAFPLACQAFGFAYHCCPRCLSPVAVGLCFPSQTPLAPVTDAFPLACEAFRSAYHCCPFPIPCGSRPLSSQSDTAGSSHRSLLLACQAFGFAYHYCPLPVALPGDKPFWQ